MLVQSCSCVLHMDVIQIQYMADVVISSFMVPVCVLYQMPTSDVPVLCQAGDAEQISTLSLAG